MRDLPTGCSTRRGHGHQKIHRGGYTDRWLDENKRGTGKEDEVMIMRVRIHAQFDLSAVNCVYIGWKTGLKM